MTRLIPVVLSILGCAPSAPAQTALQKKTTIAYLQGLQTKEGGFLPLQSRSAGPSLRATTAALRALRYFGGSATDVPAAARFARNCFHKTTGGFADSPANRKPDVISTAIGLMALVELKIPPDSYLGPAVKYLAEHARAFEEVRMAAAGLEAVRQRTAKTEAWLKQIAAMRNRDGTYGKGAGQARDTASALVTVLRLGGKVEDRAQIVRVLQKGQGRDGGFGRDKAGASDLESCYRVMRAFVMLGEKPAHVEALRDFIARCRNADGGYGSAPAQPSKVASTYFAAIILHWLDAK